MVYYGYTFGINPPTKTGLSSMLLSCRWTTNTQQNGCVCLN